MNKLDQLRQKLKEIENRKASANKSKTSSISYPFWDLAPGKSSTVRFLQDGDNDNAYFWVEKQMVKLTFPGVKGEVNTKEVSVEVPCIEMWNEKCPIMREIQPYWGTELEEVARKYWKKRTYYFQGVVIEDGVGETEKPETIIRRFSFKKQIFDIIKASLTDPEMRNMPTDFENGTNFKIVATQNGKYSSYTTSNWSRYESPLDAEIVEQIQKEGLPKLSDCLPKRPSEEAVGIIYEMFQASLEGELYDPVRWGKFYKPYGLVLANDSATDEDRNEDRNENSKESVTQNTTQQTTPQKVTQQENVEDDVPFDVEQTPKKDPRAILDMIRNRNLNK